MGEQKKKLNELDEIEKTAGDLLEELTQLEGLSTSTPPETNYLTSVKEIQTQMRETILKGIHSNDRKTFLKGLEFYEKNYAILSATGDKRVCEDYQHEMIQILTDLIVHFKKEISNPLRRYFIIISLQFVAKIYEDAQNYPRAVEIRLTISNLINSWAVSLEYAAIILDYLLSDEINKAEEFLKRFDFLESKIYLQDNNIIVQSLQSKRILNLKEFSEAVIAGTTKDLPVFFEDAKELLNEINLPNNSGFNRVSSLFNTHLEKLRQTPEIKTPIPAMPLPGGISDTQLIANIKKVVVESIQNQQTPLSKPSIPQTINTSAIITELKGFISSSIKDLSQEILNKVSKFTMITPRTQARRSSHTPDENIPDIKVVSPSSPEDKPKRPKLSDVLDSIVVSE